MPTLAEVQAAQARRSLLRFTEYTHPLYQRAVHHELIAERLEAVERGDIDRLMVFMPPRHGKSELASKRFPAWCLGRDPKRQIIAASYNSDLANDFGRNVRNLVAEPEFREVFPGVSLATDSAAANRMNTNQGGAYVAAGVGTAVTGRGAHIALIDDPFKDREEADSERRRDLVWDWYRSTLFTRLMPGGAIVLIQCMTGDTPVLLADGSERPLEDVRPGESVASYHDGRLVAAKVVNWAAQGVDCVFRIKTSSGIIVRANARHPFLVERDGKLEWTKLKNIHVGDRILKATGVSGAGRNAATRVAESQQEPRGSATHTITRIGGQEVFARLRLILNRAARRIYAIATGSTWRNTTPWLSGRAGSAQFAANGLARTSGRIGAGSFALTTATAAGGFADCYATTATSRSVMVEPRKFYSLPHSMFEAEEVLSIEPAGREMVYDIQVEGTENFIANGLVSHNTRWNEDDLAGRLLEQEGGQWEVLELPAIGENYEALWPEWYPIEALERIKATIGPREWSALYQQRPQPDEGTFFKREWFVHWDKLPELRYYGTSDYAVTDGGGDYTVLAIWGIDAKGDIYRVALWRKQTASDEWIEAQLDLVKHYKPLCWFGEGGVIQKAVEPMLRRRMKERNTYCRLEWLPSVADKPTRARSFQAMAATGRVHFEPGADLSEFLVFPAGKHDDEVDTASLIGRAIDQAHPAIVRALPDTKRGDRWDKAMGNTERGLNWKTV